MQEKFARRDVLKAAAAMGIGVGLTAGPAGAAARGLGRGNGLPADPRLPRSELRVIALVVDGLSASEISPVLMPELHALRALGTSYPNAQAISIAETLPNHVAMMTGVRGATNGVPANVIYDPAINKTRTLDQASDIHTTTLFELLRAQGVQTTAALSKKYLHSIFGTRPNTSWNPGPQIPVSDHAPDAATIDALIKEIDANDPRFMFVNLGDVDRMGHVDFTGVGPAALGRTAVLADTDAHIRRLVDHLQNKGIWQHTILLVLADHSMDWSVPHQVAGVRSAFDADANLRGNYAVAENGGAGLLYWLGDPAARDAAVATMRDLAGAQPGIERVVGTDRIGLGERAGQLAVFVKPGWRFSDPGFDNNKIPGTHGHAATLPIPFVLTGGAPILRRGAVRRDQARTLDVAATTAWLFGVSLPRGAEGRARIEAFSARPA